MDTKTVEIDHKICTNSPYPTLRAFLENFSLQDENTLNIYCYGSRVYGTATEDSDYDFIVVHNKPGKEDTEEQVVGIDGEDATLIGKNMFLKKANDHMPNIVECLFLPADKILLERQPELRNVTIDRSKLRHSFSKLVGNSYAKAGKKITVESDIKRGKKSLFHAIRIVMFGIQVAKLGKIVDYAEANPIWYEIRDNDSTNWLEDYHSKYKKVWNSVKTDFRSVAPLEEDEQEHNKKPAPKKGKS